MLEVSIRKKLDNFTLETAFSLETGCMGILGASGCGKSVTLKCIAGILTPDEGTIRLNGKVLFDSAKKINIRPQERRIGYLFQNYALFPNMTVSENIAAGFRAEHMKRGDRRELCAARVKEMLVRFSLTELADRYPKHLSGGEQQRTALARLLVGEPEVLLLDEPFSALDAYLKEELQLELLETMQRLLMPTVLVTHSRDEVYRLSSRLMIMDRGMAERPDDTKKLFSSPGSMMAAKLTGCKNIAHVTKCSDEEYFAGDWNIRFPVSASKADYIGIRAHDFVPEKEVEDGGLYIPVKISVIGISEGPFEWNAMIKSSGNPGQKMLWWKVSKEVIKTKAEIKETKQLYIRKTGILYLMEKAL
ncbi:MAG TPA: ATP-binding cassette domain-containing protein [Lachnospiraceae bacterium]|nr:ATP-binding cassette domain-containing protein [Lachnospiraceae bacterium]